MEEKQRASEDDAEATTEPSRTARMVDATNWTIDAWVDDRAHQTADILYDTQMKIWVDYVFSLINQYLSIMYFSYF